MKKDPPPLPPKSLSEAEFVLNVWGNVRWYQRDGNPGFPPLEEVVPEWEWSLPALEPVPPGKIMPDQVDSNFLYDASRRRYIDAFQQRLDLRTADCAFVVDQAIREGLFASCISPKMIEQYLLCRWPVAGKYAPTRTIDPELVRSQSREFWATFEGNILGKLDLGSARGAVDKLLSQAAREITAAIADEMYRRREMVKKAREAEAKETSTITSTPDERNAV